MMGRHVGSNVPRSRSTPWSRWTTSFAIALPWASVRVVDVASSRARSAATWRSCWVPEVVLEGDHRPDQRRHTRFFERLPDELERVAQPLGRDPELVERGEIGRPEVAVERPDGLVGVPDRRRHPVAQEPGCMGRDGERSEPRCLDEPGVVPDEPGEALRFELRDEIDAARLPLGTPRREERLEAGALAGAALRSVGHDDLDEDVEVPDGAQASPDVAQLAAIAPSLLALEPVTEDPPRGAHPAGRDAHRVDLLGVLPGDDAGHPGQHPREVEVQDLAPGLGPRIVGPDVRRPAERRGRRGGNDGRRRDGHRRVAPGRLCGVGLVRRRSRLARTHVGPDRPWRRTVHHDRIT